ncbi:MAG TPA: hypothetical protein VF121_17980 [Thermoanaerobaculia bacterium]|nr:hypothetical protein [Thermoanaerobaculia bacterium]
MSRLGVCYCFTLPPAAAGEETRIASMLLDLSRSRQGADGMAMLVSRLSRNPRQVYLFPGSQPHVRGALKGLLEQYEARVCEPPRSDEVVFLVGSPEVWKRLAAGRDGSSS